MLIKHALFNNQRPLASTVFVLISNFNVDALLQQCTTVHKRHDKNGVEERIHCSVLLFKDLETCCNVLNKVPCIMTYVS